VTRLLRTEVGLRDAWTDARLERARRQARRTWEDLSRKNPASGAKYLRLAEPAAYAWLYRNDRPWLEDANRAIESRRRASVSTKVVFLDGRDRHLAQELRSASLTFSEQHPCQRITLSDIHRCVPALREAMTSLDRIPVTMLVLSRVLASRPTPGAHDGSEQEPTQLNLDPEN
jgi:hypothetical protein